jgi:hypothetical protein
MRRPAVEVADVVGRHGEAFLQSHSTSRQQRRVMRAIVQCRTAALGGHLYQCSSCAHQVPVYNSCRNRHCPKCQSLAKAKWLEARQQELLPVTYYHLVFTLPDSLAQLALQNAPVIYNLLFRAVSDLEMKDWRERYRELTGEDLRLCPACKRGRLIPMQTLLPLTSLQTKGVTGYDSS